MTAPDPKLPMYDLLEAYMHHGIDAYYRLVAGGLPHKVVVAKIKDASNKGYLDYGTSPQHAWLRPEGINTLRRWRTEGRPQ